MSSVNDRPWWRELTSYQWWVFIVAILGWLFDAMDQYLFLLVRTPALQELLPAGTSDPELAQYAGFATTIFILGWATGGVVFGLFSDRWGRTRALMVTILLYSLFTGLSALSRTWWDFALYRFLTGLGIGGEWAAGVALVAEVMPVRTRAYALGLMQALSALGALTGAALTLAIRPQAELGDIWPVALGPPLIFASVSGWRLLFLIGALPALLIVIIRLRLHESPSWLAARARAELGERSLTGGPGSTPDEVHSRLGDLREVFRDRRWRYHTLIGVALGMAGQIGWWGVGLFSPELIRASLLQSRGAAPGQTLEDLARATTGNQDEGQNLARTWKEEDDTYAGRGVLLLSLGAFLGGFVAPYVAIRLGRRPTFALAFFLGLLATWFVFALLHQGSDVYWMMPLLGFCPGAFYAVYAVYFPELYPTRLRSTGAGLCYNFARYLTALGPSALGSLTVLFGWLGYATPLRAAGMTVAMIYLVGVAAVPFAPETKDMPLPE